MAWFGKIGSLFRRYSASISTTGIAAVVATYFYPETLGLRHYRSVMEHYKDGAILPVDSKTQQLIEKVFYFLLELPSI